MSTCDSSRQVSDEISPAASQCPSAKHSRPASKTSASVCSRRKREHIASPPLTPTPCSAVMWDGHQQQCVREPLPTPDVLRAFLEERLISDHDARPATAAVAVAAAIVVVGAAKASEDVRSSERDVPRGKPVLILRGLAPAFLRVLMDVPLGVDAAFVEAHAAKRRYRPRPGLAATAMAAQWNYPELVGGFARALWRRGEGAVLPIRDVLGRAAVRAVSDCEDLAAVECRASVWVTERVDVLLLDTPVWEDPGGLLKKARRKTVVTGTKTRDEETEEKGLWDVSSTTGQDEDIPSFEDALQETMSLSADATGSKLVDILEQAAYDKWLDYFEALTPRQTPLVADGMSIEWRALQALEGNLDMAKRLAHDRRSHGGSTTTTDSLLPDWLSLLQRLRDRVALLATVPPALGAGPHVPIARNHRTLHADNFARLPIPPRQRSRSPPAAGPVTSGGGGGDDENQRALDRVTYLGGILLPISIVSSVLSMNQDFEPGQPLFWVFWAAAVPLTLVTFVIIYADKLRGAEVWVDAGSLDAGSSSSEDQGADGQEEEEEEKGKKKKTTTPDWNRLADHGRVQWTVDGRARMQRPPPPLPIRPQAMAYAGEDVVIDLSDAVAESRPISPRRRRRTSQESDDNTMDHHRPPPPSSSPPSSLEPYQPSDNDDQGLQDPDMYVTRPALDGARPHAWRKKQLGWGGAAMCILGMQKPLRVQDGLPVTPRPRRNVERRRPRQGRREASGEGRGMLVVM